MQFSEAWLLAQAAGFTWTLARVSALFVVFPLFSGHIVPQPVRALLSVAVVMLLLPNLPPMPEVALFSLGGFLIGVQQFLIGAAMGFVLHLVFGAVMFGGQSAAYGMGLGFASLVDPVTGVQAPVISQFYQLCATLTFLALDGHLLLIRLLADSFQTLPVGWDGISHPHYKELALWTGRMLAAGLLMSLPIVTALLLVNLGFGIAGRAAPQLNIFSVGFPITLLLGMWLLQLSLPDVMSLFSGFLDEGYLLIQRIMQ